MANHKLLDGSMEFGVITFFPLTRYHKSLFFIELYSCLMSHLYAEYKNIHKHSRICIKSWFISYEH